MPKIPPLPVYLASASLRGWPGKNHLQGLLRTLPELAADLGFQGVTVADRELAGWPETAITDLAARCRRYDCGLIFDLNADLALTNADSLAKELLHLRCWLDRAATHQVTRVRLAIGGQTVSYQRLFHPRKIPQSGQPRTGVRKPSGPANVAKRLVDGLVPPLSRWLRRQLPPSRPRPCRALERVRFPLALLLSWARQRNIRIGIENHWGVTTHPEELQAILTHFDSPFLGSCPDFGNFPPHRNPYRGLELLAPRAVMVHAKSHAFTPLNEESSINYRRCLEILRRARFRGPLCVEYEGRRDPIRGIIKTRDLIRRYQASTRPLR